MADILGPIIGLIMGASIIVFRKSISIFIESSYDKFPKYKNGVKAFNLRFSIRPFFIGLFGMVVIVLSIISFLVIISS